MNTMMRVDQDPSMENTGPAVPTTAAPTGLPAMPIPSTIASAPNISIARDDGDVARDEDCDLINPTAATTNSSPSSSFNLLDFIPNTAASSTGGLSSTGGGGGSSQPPSSFVGITNHLMLSSSTTASATQNDGTMGSDMFRSMSPSSAYPLPGLMPTVVDASDECSCSSQRSSVNTPPPVEQHPPAVATATATPTAPPPPPIAGHQPMVMSPNHVFHPPSAPVFTVIQPLPSFTQSAAPAATEYAESSSSASSLSWSARNLTHQPSQQASVTPGLRSPTAQPRPHHLQQPHQPQQHQPVTMYYLYPHQLTQQQPGAPPPVVYHLPQPTLQPHPHSTFPVVNATVTTQVPPPPRPAPQTAPTPAAPPASKSEQLEYDTHMSRAHYVALVENGAQRGGIGALAGQQHQGPMCLPRQEVLLVRQLVCPSTFNVALSRCLSRFCIDSLPNMISIDDGFFKNNGQLEVLSLGGCVLLEEIGSSFCEGCTRLDTVRILQAPRLVAVGAGFLKDCQNTRTMVLDAPKLQKHFPH